MSMASSSEEALHFPHHGQGFQVTIGFHHPIQFSPSGSTPHAQGGVTFPASMLNPSCFPPSSTFWKGFRCGVLMVAVITAKLGRMNFANSSQTAPSLSIQCEVGLSRRIDWRLARLVPVSHQSDGQWQAAFTASDDAAPRQVLFGLDFSLTSCSSQWQKVYYAYAK